MPLPNHSFILHDVSQFPLVWARDEAAVPGYAGQWRQEMDTLLDHGQPYVLIHGPHQHEEIHEDRKQRGLWLKHNKLALQRVCLALIRYEPDPEQRARIQAMAHIAIQAFGIAHEVLATREQAEAAARRHTRSGQRCSM